LNPDLNIWKTSEEVVRSWIERKLGPLGKIEQAVGGAGVLTGLALRVPKLVDDAHKFQRKLEQLVEAHSMPVNPWPTRFLGVCAVALVVIATRLVLR